MVLLYCLGLLLYYLVVFRSARARGSDLSKLLWFVYFGLGVSALFIAATGIVPAVFAPHYPSALFLMLCVLISVHGFTRFKSANISNLIGNIPGQRLLEDFLIFSQFLAIAFFLPFAISSLTGDANENRLNLDSKIDVLASFGLVNTAASAACQLFSTSLAMAFLRLSQPTLSIGALRRALLLTLASLSYVIYILAYVGRDGIVYWVMTALMMVVVFKPHLGGRARRTLVVAGSSLLALLLVPFFVITVARFVDTDRGTAWSLFEYFGSQINNFSDYSSIDRPVTLGVLNFPIVINAACTLAGVGCESWADIKEFIFDIYLAQDKEPWLFGTFVSDFVGDFGYTGALILVSLLSWSSYRLCTSSASPRAFTLSRLLLILFIYLIPFWGVFYFRFSIANGYIIVNMLFIVLVAIFSRVSWPARGQARYRSNPRP